MKFSKLLTSIAVAVTLLWSGATALSANTKANASKFTKVNGYYKDGWPSYIASTKYYGFATDYLKSDDKHATYMKNTFLWEDDYKMKVETIYYDANHNILPKYSYDITLHLPYYKSVGSKDILATSPSASAKTVLIFNRKTFSGHGKFNYRVMFTRFDGKNSNFECYCHLYKTGDEFHNDNA